MATTFVDHPCRSGRRARRAAAAAASRFAEGQLGSAALAAGHQFPPRQGGEGRIVVDLSDTSTGIDIRQQGQTVIVDFLKTSVPDTLRKRYDVADFATPVQTFSTFPQGDNVRMVIEPKGLWEHNAYQTDTQFVLEVKPIQYDPNKLVQGTRTGYSGEKLSLNFQNVEVRSVLNVIADFTDLNIITSDTVAGQPDPAPEGRALGSGAGHHPADPRPGHAQERQRDLDRAARRTRHQGKARARVEQQIRRTGAGAHRDLPAQLRQGRRSSRSC